MDLIVPTYPALTQLAIPAFIGLILLELFVIRRLKTAEGFETRDTTTSLLMGVGNVVTGLIFGFVAYGVLIWSYDFRIFTIGFEWYWVLVCFILDDARYYFYHRIASSLQMGVGGARYPPFQPTLQFIYSFEAELDRHIYWHVFAASSFGAYWISSGPYRFCRAELIFSTSFGYIRKRSVRCQDGLKRS